MQLQQPENSQANSRATMRAAAAGTTHPQPETTTISRTSTAVTFVRDQRNYPPYTKPEGDAARFEIGETTTADDLYYWLRAKNPARKRK